jgi:hypothetical protein
LGEGVPGFEHFDEGIEAAGFDEVVVGAEFEGFFDVGAADGGAEDIDAEVAELGVGTDGGKDIEAVDAGEFEIEKNGDGVRVLISVVEFAGAAEVIEGLLAVGDEMEAVFEAGAGPGFGHEGGVVGAVFDEEDEVMIEV